MEEFNLKAVIRRHDDAEFSAENMMDVVVVMTETLEEYGFEMWATFGEGDHLTLQIPAPLV